MNAVLRFISRYYDERLESVSVRILYFFNTIDTFFLVSGILSFSVLYWHDISPLPFLFGLGFAILTARLADFYPYFIAPGIVAMGILFLTVAPDPAFVALLILANVAVFLVIQFGFMGIPDSIVARDWKVAFLKIFNSLFTVAPTTVSFSMSVFFSFYLSFMLLISVEAAWGDWRGLSAGAAILLLGALATRLMLPKNRFSKFHKPDIEAPRFKRVIILNIDGCRKDIFDAIDLPTVSFLKENGSYHRRGLRTVYRALTNPAFASIFTGTVPEVHGVKDNNFGQHILTDGLPDVVASVAYGSMHVKHFCKNSWTTRVVSLPSHSVYKSDAVALGWLKKDLMQDDHRLFVFDFSEADFLGHAYGSTSEQYKTALRKIDTQIGDLLEWMRENDRMQDTAVIICSDHGIAAIDHSYLLAASEIHVPFILYGDGIRKGHVLERPGTIMDICVTTAYLLGVSYPHDARGQVFTDALEGSDFVAEASEFAHRFNRIKYGVEAHRYAADHAEIYEGDRSWWDDVLAHHATVESRGLRILDIGSGSGFVAQRFLASGLPIDSFVCNDLAPEMLERVRETYGNDTRFSFVSDLDGVKGPFDVVCASSVFHHMPVPETLGGRIDTLLAPGGLMIGSHEPSRKPFESGFYRCMASMYKRLGGGVRIDRELVEAFNRVLKRDHPNAPRVGEEEILQIVEYHSPVEQYLDGVDPTAGFLPDRFFADCFPGYERLEFEAYTTFFYRPFLSGRVRLQRALSRAYRLLFDDGNLFRFVLRKPCA